MYSLSLTTFTKFIIMERCDDPEDKEETLL